VKVRLTKKLAQAIDGVDLSGRRVGDSFDLPAEKATLLLAEEWAAPERREHGEKIVNGRRVDDPRLLKPRDVIDFATRRRPHASSWDDEEDQPRRAAGF